MVTVRDFALLVSATQDSEKTSQCFNKVFCDYSVIFISVNYKKELLKDSINNMK